MGHRGGHRELRLVVTLTPSDKDMQAFKIMNGDELIATGNLSKLKSNEVTKLVSAPPVGEKKDTLDQSTFYNRIARNGYNYEEAFQLVRDVTFDDSAASSVARTHVSGELHQVNEGKNLLTQQIIILADFS